MNKLASVLKEELGSKGYIFTSKVKGCPDKMYFADRLSEGGYIVWIDCLNDSSLFAPTLDKVRDIIDTQHLSRLAIQIDSVRFMDGL